MFDAGEIAATLDLDRSPFNAGLAAAQQDAEEWARQRFTATLGADLDPALAEIAALKDSLDDLTGHIDTDFDSTELMAQIEAIRTAMATLGDLTLGSDFQDLSTEAKIEALRTQLEAFQATYTAQADLNTEPAETDLGLLSSRLRAYSASRPTATLRLDTGPAMAQLRAFQATVAASVGKLGVVTAGGGRGGGKDNALLGGLAGGAADGGGESLATMIMGTEGRSFLSRFLSPLTMLGTLFSAQFGSIGSLAGFGPEHLATTALGIGGLGVGAGAGGALLGLGTLGKMGVGSGSDMLVSHETMSNVTALIAGTTTLTQLIGKVGPAAALAESQVASSWTALKADFDTASGAAQVMAASIDDQFIKLGTVYTPLIVAAAEQNLSIINSSLRPLFSWLEGPQGIGIFEHLEDEFRSQLPTSINAVVNGVELFIKTINYASTFTGSFIDKIDAWLKKTNSPTGIAKWDAEIRKLIGDFRVVSAFLEALGKDIINVFKNDAGTTTAVIKEMTAGLQQLGRWINSVGGSHELRNLFSVHKTETLQLMRSLAELLMSFGATYLKIAPYMVSLVADVLKLANAFFSLTQRIPGVSELTAVAIALFIMEERAHTLTTTMKLLRDVWNLPTNIVGVLRNALNAEMALELRVQSLSIAIITNTAALGQWAAALVGVTFESDLLNLALGAGVLGAIVAIGSGIYELVKHFGVLRGLMIAGAAAVGILTIAFIALDTVPVVALIAGIALGLAGLVAALIWVADNWSTVWAHIKSVFDSAVNFLRSGFGTLVVVATGPIAPLLLLALHWKQVWNGIKTVAVDVWHALETAWGAVSGFFKKLPGEMFNAHNWATALDFLKALPDKIFNFLLDIPPELGTLGHDAMMAMFSAMETVGSILLSFVESLPGRIWDGLDDLGHLLSDLATGAWHLFLSVATAVGSALLSFVESLPGRILNGLESLAVLLWGLAVRAWHLFLSAAQTLGGDAVSFVESLPGKFLDAVKGFGTLLYDAGKDLIEGLINGIKGMAGGAVSSILSIGSSILSGFKNFLGIHSPSTVMTGVGMDLMRGLTQGITAGSGEAVTTALGVAHQITGAFGSLSQASLLHQITASMGSDLSGTSRLSTGVSTLPSGLGAPPTQINLNYRGGNITVNGAKGSPKEIARQVKQAIDQSHQDLANKLYAVRAQ